MASMVTGILAALAGIGLLAALWFVPDHRLGLLGGLLLAVGPVLVIYARKYRRLQAVTGSEGVALIENDAVLPCRWHDIQIVRETQLAGELQSTLKASVRGEDHLFHITCRDGKELIFRSFLDDLAWLGQIIQHETLSHLLPPSLSALKNGEVLQFGPLSLDSEGLRSGPERCLSWDEVQDVEIAHGLLLVKQVGKWRSWFKTPISQVPNAHLLLALVQQLPEKRDLR